MTAVLLALLSAVAYGASDFLSGVASRLTHYVRVSLLTQLSMTAATWIAVLLAGGASTSGALTWGLIAGIGSSAGTLLLYRGLGAGQMNVVAPLSAATAAVLPVLAGLVGGERPSWMVLAGVVVLLPAIWLVSSAPSEGEGSGRFADGALDGLLAGVGFALSFVALDRAPSGSGLWPAAYAQLAAGVVIAVMALLLRRRSRTVVERGRDEPVDGERWMPRRAAIAAVVSGLLGAVAVGAFLLSTSAGLLVVASVLTALYPAVTVLLARAVFAERTAPTQLGGLMLAGVGVVLVVMG